MTAPTEPPFPRIAVVGAGVIGREIALHAACHRRTVAVLDIDAAVLETAAATVRRDLTLWADALGAVLDAPVEDVLARITFTADREAALREADLVIEAVPEALRLKRDVLGQTEAATADAILVTTSSYFTPGQLCRKLTRPERFAALHFHSPVSFSRAVDVCGHARTDPAVLAGSVSSPGRSS